MKKYAGELLNISMVDLQLDFLNKCSMKLVNTYIYIYYENEIVNIGVTYFCHAMMEDQFSTLSLHACVDKRGKPRSYEL